MHVAPCIAKISTGEHQHKTHHIEVIEIDTKLIACR